MIDFLQVGGICCNEISMAKGSNGYRKYERLEGLLVRIAGGRAVPMPSTDREAIAAIDNGWNDYRRLYCSWYGRCLDYAAEAKWPGFTCRMCAVDEPIDDDTRRIENLALIRRISLLDVGGTADRRRG